MAALFNKRLAELKMNRIDFIRKFHADWGEDVGAENHLYKILAGGANPSEDDLLPKMAKSMRLNLNDALKALRADKTEDKGWADVMPESNATIKQVVRLMDSLSDKDQEEVLQIVRIKAKA